MTGAATVDTPSISDALDTLGLSAPGAPRRVPALTGRRRGPVAAGGLSGIGHVTGAPAAAGPAWTVRYEPVARTRAAPAGDFVDEVPPGAMVVIANAGRTWCTVWGDILSTVAHARRLAGTVIDGACRDVAASGAIGYPLWARGAFMRSGKNRVRLVAVQQPVRVAGVRVSPGDLVCADASGVVVVPRVEAGRVLDLAAEIKRVEAAILEDVAAGVPLRTARADHRYHAYARPTR